MDVKYLMNDLNSVNLNSFKQLLKEDILKREINHLIHFTNIKNLPSILSNGILSIQDLQKDSLNYLNNDCLRLDGYPNSISLSVSFPNYSMLSKYRLYSEKPQRMAIILIDPSILWELDCAFYPTNAANGIFSNTNISSLKNLQAWNNLFEPNTPDKNRLILNIPENFTTDPQAEVLCLNSIPPSKIKSIFFDSESTFDIISKQLPDIQDFYFEDTPTQYFAPRSDYLFWKK